MIKEVLLQKVCIRAYMDGNEGDKGKFFRVEFLLELIQIDTKCMKIFDPLNFI